MPSRAFYHQTADGCLSRKNRDFEATEFPFPETFPTSDKVDVGMDEWDEWMKWDGPSTEGLTSLDSYSPYSNTSNDALWPTNIDTNLDTFDQMAIDDAPYEVDDSVAVPELDIEQDLPTPERQLRPNQRRPYYGYSSLTVAEERELQQIAMPPRSDSIISTTTTTSDSQTPPISPDAEPTTRPRTKKRKSSTKDAATDVTAAGELCQSRKRGHNAIEKRYRTNLNEKIVLLRQSVPSLRVLPEGEVLAEDNEDGPADEKYGKAVVLMRAVEYISHLEDCTERLGRETLALKARVAAFEKLAMAGAMQMSGVASAVASRAETLDSIKADFQQSSYDKAEKTRNEPRPRKRTDASRSGHARSSSAKKI